MSGRQRRFLLLALAAAVLASACGSGEGTTDGPAGGDPRLSVYVVNYPLRYFAERIGGDLVRVVFPAPPDEDPAFWSPDAATIAEFQQADLILLNGAGYATWVSRATLPLSRLVDTSAALRDRYVVVEDTAVHSHGPQGEHSHGEVAFTTWLDFSFAVEQARAIRDAFVSAMPDRQALLDGAFEELERDLHEIDQDFAGLIEGREDRPLVASHPVYQYFQRRFGLSLESVHFEPDEFPDGKSWRGLERLLARHPARSMLWEAEPLDESLEALQTLDVNSVVFDPCGNTPEEGDFLTVMERNLANLEAVFR